MKYLVNPQGRAVSVDDKRLTDLLQKGFIEITKEQFIPGKLYSEFVGKTQYIPAAVSQKKTNTKKREFFDTTIV